MTLTSTNDFGFVKLKCQNLKDQSRKEPLYYLEHLKLNKYIGILKIFKINSFEISNDNTSASLAQNKPIGRDTAGSQVKLLDYLHLV